MNIDTDHNTKRPIRVPMSVKDSRFVEEARILYASLDEQDVRRASIKRNIGARTTYAIMSCVDGRQWTDVEVDGYLSSELRKVREKAKLNGRTWLASGAVACAITHRDHLIANCFSIGKVLCEDDAILQDDFVDLIALGVVEATLNKLPGIILLNYRSKNKIAADSEPVAQIGRYTVHRASSGGIASAAAYFVPSGVAQRIVEAQSPLRWPVDAWQAMRTAQVFDDVFLVHPSPARVGDFPSTINYGRNGNWVRDALRKNKVLRRMRWWHLGRSGKMHTAIHTWT